MASRDDQYSAALKVAQLYYYHAMNTEEIARTLGFSRAKVSRLLNYARDDGIVRIKVVDHRRTQDPLSEAINDRFRGLHALHVVSVPAESSPPERIAYVAQYAAAHLGNEVLSDDQIVAVAAGESTALTARFLSHRSLKGVRIVQMHGSSPIGIAGVGYVHRVLMPFAAALDAELILFPVPIVFDSAEAREVLFREPTVRSIRDYQSRADVFIFGVDDLVFDARRRWGERIEPDIVGELATVALRSDGSYEDVAMNRLTTGPALDTYRRVARAVCIASGSSSVPTLHAALDAGYISDLIVDDVTATELRDFDASSAMASNTER
ncbi:MAG: sugar-binding transcriptional regulator [Spirochaetales bacterium]|nr:sugar-binding transcriptional regulator [Spirochaetales bacterium]